MLTLHDGGLHIEADPALLEEAVATMGLSGSAGVSTPSVVRDFFPQQAQDDLVRIRLNGESKKGKGEAGDDSKAHEVDGELQYRGTESEENR